MSEPAKRIAEARDLARQLVGQLRPLGSSDRSDILDVLKDAFCLRCGDDGGRRCWCDYESR